MKETTGDLWPESRSTTNGIEPTGVRGGSPGGTGHFLSTSLIVEEVEAVKWVTGHQAAWLTNPEIRE
ncbi:hypothetical protein WBG99_28800 [Streptomyces sp. TG1A-60]|uniref:hypothetical protein n=1 Tax=Streptomyces sp. TG1A-60 TaxID=3129111 RepID=UPI0030CE1F83